MDAVGTRDVFVWVKMLLLLGLWVLAHVLKGVAVEYFACGAWLDLVGECVVLWVVWLAVQELAEKPRMQRLSVARVLVEGVGAFICACVVVYGVGVLLFLLWGLTHGSSVVAGSGVALLVPFFTQGVLAPITEELVFRRGVQRSLSEVYSETFAVMMSALIFACVHFNTTALLQMFLFGCILGCSYQRTQSILSPITAHVLWNSTAFLKLL